MMKIDLKTIIILFFVLLCIVLSFQINKISDRDRKMVKVLSGYKNQYEQLKSKSDNNAILFKMQHYIEGDTLDNVELLHWDSETKIRLTELLTTQSHFFFYISEGGCTSCLSSYLKELSSFTQQYGNRKITILAHFTDKKNLKYLLGDNLNILDIYTMHNPLKLFPKDNSYPVLFLLSKDLRIENAFIADKSNFNLGVSYLKVIEYRYLKPK